MFLRSNLRSLRDAVFALRGRIAPQDLTLAQQLSSAYALLRHLPQQELLHRCSRIAEDIGHLSAGSSAPAVDLPLGDDLATSDPSNAPHAPELTPAQAVEPPIAAVPLGWSASDPRAAVRGDRQLCTIPQRRPDMLADDRELRRRPLPVQAPRAQAVDVEEGVVRRELRELKEFVCGRFNYFDLLAQERIHEMRAGRRDDLGELQALRERVDSAERQADFMMSCNQDVHLTAARNGCATRWRRRTRPEAPRLRRPSGCERQHGQQQL